MQGAPKIIGVTFVEGFSGINDYIFNNLKIFRVPLIVDAFYIPFWVKFLALAKSFSFNRLLWGKSYYKILGGYTKRPDTFMLRTRHCTMKLKAHIGKVNLVFQVSALFLASEDKLTVPYVIYIDFTSKMAERWYPAWVPFRCEEERLRWHQLETMVYQVADKILVFNELVGESLRIDYGIYPKKISVVGSGVNLDDLSDFDKNYKNKVILFVGRDFERHGGGYSLEDFDLIQQKISNSTLYIVGSSLKCKNPKVITLGNLEKQDLDKLYRKASVLLMPASVGGLQTILEAMARKCVVVANPENPHLQGLINDGENGFWVSPYNKEMMIEKLIEILSNSDFCREVGREAFSSIKNNFTWPEVVKRMEKEFLNLTGFKPCV